MAKLEKLGDFDKEFRLAQTDLRTLVTTRGSRKGVWSPEQEVEFSKLIGAVNHTLAALGILVHTNR